MDKAPYWQVVAPPAQLKLFPFRVLTTIPTVCVNSDSE